MEAAPIPMSYRQEVAELQAGSSREKSPTPRETSPTPSTSFQQHPTTSAVAAKLETSSSVRFSQPSISKALKSVTSFSEGGSKNLKITNCIVYFVCKDNMPFSTVEGEGFRKLINEIAPLYKIPARNTIKNYIDKKYDALATSFKHILQELKHVTLTTDIWTDLQTKSFLGVTIHYIFESKLESATLGVIELGESHTAQYISSELSKVLFEWNINNNAVVAVVTDNGANIVKAMYDTFGKNKHIPCFAHTLNLVCENSITNTKGLNEVLTKVRTIVTWFKRSVHASDQLRKHQSDKNIPEGKIKKIILDVKTRWNSTFYMISRFVELAPLIANIIFNNVNAPEMLTGVEIEHLKEIVQLLHPLEKITTEVCAEKFVTISKIIPMLRCVKAQYNDKIKPSSALGQQLKKVLLSEFDKRFGQIEKSHLLANATILDPRFKQLHFQDALACASTINSLKQNLIAESEPSAESSTESESGDDSFDLWDYHKELAHSKRKKTNDASDEVTQYLQSPVHILSQDPLMIWNEIKSVFPNLYKNALKHMGIVSTSVPCERLFSKAGATATKTRNRLTSKRLSKLLFLQSLPDKYWN